MGVPKKELEDEIISKLFELEVPKKMAAEQLGVSVPTVSRIIARYRTKQEPLIQYRGVQSLQLTDYQAKILERVTDDKIDEAPLRDLVLAFKVFKEKELLLEGKPSEIKGLIGYIVSMEQELKKEEEFIDVESNEDAQEAEFEDESKENKAKQLELSF